MKKVTKAIALLISLLYLMTAVSCGTQSSVSSLKPPAQTDKSTLRSDIYPARVSFKGDQKWGYIDNFGRFVIQPEFSQAHRFQYNDLAIAGEGDKVGLIDRKGRFVVAPVYLEIGDFSDGNAVALDDSGFKVLDSKGKVISDTYPYIGKYKSNRAAYYIQAQDNRLRYGYLDETGKTVIEPAFEYAWDFEGERAVVKFYDKGYGLIDKSGNVLKYLKYSYVMDIADGMIAFVPEQGGKYGYLNSRGDVAIAPSFQTAMDFKDGTAVVNAAEDYSVNKFGLIDKNGKYLIKPQYNDILQLGEGMAAVGTAIDPSNMFAGSKYALATLDGKLITDFIFYGMEPFKNGMASVYDNTSTFFIDKTGKRVENLPAVDGTGALELVDSMVYADVDQRPFYMNTQGSIVYRPSKSILLKSGVKVSEEKFKTNRDYLVYYPSLSGLDNLKVEESINTKLKDMWTDPSIKPADNLDYHYEGDFNIGFNKKNLIVLEKTGYDYPFGAAHGMPAREYAHADIKTGAFYRLEDLFKDNSSYAEVLSGIVEEQIKEHGEEMGVWEDSYKGIRPDQPFYLTEDALMLYFTPYEIAPYAAGFPTFRVPYTEISEIIDKRGSFWLSFN